MFVYLIECVPVGIYKIGYARDPAARTRELERLALGPARYRYGLSWHDEVKPWQSASCKPYRLLWQAPADDYRAAERALHRLFAEKRISVEGWRGPEWFTLDAVDIDYISSVDRFEAGIAVPGEEVEGKTKSGGSDRGGYFSLHRRVSGGDFLASPPPDPPAFTPPHIHAAQQEKEPPKHGAQAVTTAFRACEGRSMQEAASELLRTHHRRTSQNLSTSTHSGE